MSLQAINPTIPDEGLEEMTNQIDRVACLEPSKLADLYKVDELKDELKMLNQELERRAMEKEKRDPNAYSSMTKSAYIFYVIKARTRLISKDKNFTKNRIRSIEEIYRGRNEEEKRNFKERVDNELSNKFLSLKETKPYVRYAASSYKFVRNINNETTTHSHTTTHERMNMTTPRHTRTRTRTRKRDASFFSSPAFSIGVPMNQDGGLDFELEMNMEDDED